MSRQENNEVFQFGTKAWADNQLSFCIHILQGKQCGGHWNSNLQLALIIKQRFEVLGFQWHAKRVENWIHRCKPSSRKLSFGVELSDPQLPEGADSERERENSLELKVWFKELMQKYAAGEVV